MHGGFSVTSVNGCVVTDDELCSVAELNGGAGRRRTLGVVQDDIFQNEFCGRPILGVPPGITHRYQRGFAVGIPQAVAAGDRANRVVAGQNKAAAAEGCGLLRDQIGQENENDAACIGTGGNFGSVRERGERRLRTSVVGIAAIGGEKELHF